MNAAELTTLYLEISQEETDIRGHLPTFLRLIEEMDAATPSDRPVKVIELGTRSGVSTVAWLHGLDMATPGSHLWSVDIDMAPPIGTHEHWTFVQGSDLDPRVFEELPGDADIVFIDTSHTYDQTRAELSLYQHFVRPGGLIVMHDTDLIRPEDSPPTDPPYPVRTAMLEYVEREGRDHVEIPGYWGLGIVQM